jgi:mRNA interferase RelE/StbE
VKTYKVVLARAARKDLESLAARLQDRIMAALENLKDNPRPPGSKKLKGTVNTFRIRAGQYRVVYEVHDKEVMVLVIRVRHRKDAYK